MAQVQISGRLATGVGQATGFTGLEWVRAAFSEHFGFDVHPGTVNLVVKEASLVSWRMVKAAPAIVLHPPRPDWCDAHLWRATIAGRVAAGIVLPVVPGYPERQLELVAGIRVRDMLGLEDGDTVLVTAETP